MSERATRRSVRMVGVVTLVLLAAGCSVGLGGEGDQSAEAIEASIRAMAEDQGPVDKVSCPGPLQLFEGETVKCEVTTPIGVFVATAKAVEEGGKWVSVTTVTDVRWISPRGVSDWTQKFVRRSPKWRHVTVQCREGVDAKIGASARCTLRGSGGRETPVVTVVTEIAGAEVNFAVREP